jgi:hypothetical protein
MIEPEARPGGEDREVSRRAPTRQIQTHFLVILYLRARVTGYIENLSASVWRNPRFFLHRWYHTAFSNGGFFVAIPSDSL